MYGREPALEKCPCICRYILLTPNAATGIWLRRSRGKAALGQETMAECDWKSLRDCSAGKKKDVERVWQKTRRGRGALGVPA